ncbi:GP158 protein, partial [Polypterus senegalus]|nr:probable G-protein coupled receptor 158 [Polypterus senegalus]MBN3293813.1 GP158 protein [Polypterus senegalus]
MSVLAVGCAAGEGMKAGTVMKVCDAGWVGQQKTLMEVVLLHLVICAFIEGASGLGVLAFERGFSTLASSISTGNVETEGPQEMNWSGAGPAATFFASIAPTNQIDKGTSTEATGSTGPEQSEQDATEVAESFLYSGDSARLSLSNCTRRHHLKGVSGSPSRSLHPFLRSALDTLTHAANFLNMIFQTNDIRESSIKEDIEWYHSLVRSIVEGDPKIFRAVLSFDTEPTSTRPQLVLQATRDPTVNEIKLQDLSSSWDQLRNLSDGSDWFTELKFQEGPPPSSYLHKRILSNDLRTLDTPKWNRGDSYVMDRQHVRWSKSPFLECQGGKFLPNWMATMSTSFYGLKPDLSPEFKGVIRIDVNLQSFDIDQCATGEDWFADTHQCNRTSSQCVSLRGMGFRLGQYRCVCLPGFYNASSSSVRNTTKEQDEEGFTNRSRAGVEEGGGVLSECLPCHPGCPLCQDGAPCNVQEDWYLRVTILAVQAFCMLIVFISMIVAYHFRQSKRIRASGLVLLETILFGSLLLYFPVFILYFKPSIFRCILLRWVRLLGFAIVYGTVMLKMYRVLKVFLSRTAQRVPYMTSGRVLKMLAVIVLTVSWFLSAWTAGVLENMDRDVPIFVTSQTPEGLRFSICDLDRWDYMMAIAELLFLCWGSSLCYSVRTVPSAFHEPRYMGIAIHNEMLVSATFHLLRFILLPSLHPDWMLLLFFTHTHVTISVTLGLLFIPKFLHMSSPLREEIATEVYEDELDMRRSGSYLNSSITSAWSEHSLDPDDIRDELKKLYAQLEVHKTKKMTANNPHLQKKRSSRRGLGRSIMKRITEIPESMSRQCSRDDKEGSQSSRGLGGASHPGTCKKKHFEPVSSSMKVKEDSIKHRVFSLRKSHSTYDHVRDSKEAHSHLHRSVESKDSSLLDSLMRKKLARKSCEHSETDSIDGVPLVYKSASAHNLTVDKKPLHHRPVKLQKSLSVITSSKETAHLLSGKSYSMEDNSKRLGGRGIEKENEDKRTSAEDGETEAMKYSEPIPKTMHALLKEDYDKAEVCPWEIEPQPCESKVQKHVTYAPMNSDYPKMGKSWQIGTSWESVADKTAIHHYEGREPKSRSSLKVTEDAEKRSSTGDRMQRIERPGEKEMKESFPPADLYTWDSDSQDEPEKERAKVPVSSSAPGSPVTIGKNKEPRGFPRSFGLSMKGLRGSGKAKEFDAKEKVRKGMVKRKEKKEVMAKGAVQQKDREVTQLNETRKNEVDNKTDVCPWETEEFHGVADASAVVEQCVLDSNKNSEGGNDEKPTTDVGGTSGEHKSKCLDSSPVEVTVETVLPPEISMEPIHKTYTTKGIDLAEVCPWEAECLPALGEKDCQALPIKESTSSKNQHSHTIVGSPLSPPADISPHKLEEAGGRTTFIHSSKDPTQASHLDSCLTSTEESKAGFAQEADWKKPKESDPELLRREEICPWEMDELKPASGQKATLSEILPWETQAPHGMTEGIVTNRTDVCPWEDEEAANAEHTDCKEAGKTNAPSSLLEKKADVCPWDYE